ncbi:MAG: hypothetical protein M5U12_35810 [Verrucomicrobia bacterium]|nr:hypothetical protein [Verrucomicrobiota bacterium]
MPPAVTGSWDAHTNVFSLGHLQTEFRTRSWTSEDGLPQNTINCLFQASDGYLWIGTRSGLARYDGRRFTLYDRRNTPALRSPDIQALAENPPGTLWIGTRHGLARRVNHVFMDVPLPDSDGFVRSICPRRAGGVWLGTGAGPMWVEGDAVFAYTNYPPFHPSWDATARILDVDAVLEDTAGDLWLRDPRGLVRLRAGQTEFEIMAAYKNDEIRLYNGAGLLADRGGAIWFGWGVGLCRWQEGRIESWPRNPDPQAGNGLRGEPGPLAWGWDGALWFGDSWGGLSRWQDGRFIHFRPPSGLSDELVASLLSDREGTLWVGTKNGGLNRLQRRRFVNLTTVDGLADNAVWSIAEGPDGSVWMATDRGLSRYRDGVFRTFHLSQPDPFTSNDWNHFTVVLAAPSGQVWAGSWAGLCQVRSDTVEQFRVRVGDTNHPVPAGTIAADRSGTVGGRAGFISPQRRAARGLCALVHQPTARRPCRPIRCGRRRRARGSHRCHLGGHQGRRRQPSAGRSVRWVHSHQRLPGGLRRGGPGGPGRHRLVRLRSGSDPRAARSFLPVHHRARTVGEPCPERARRRRRLALAQRTSRSSAGAQARPERGGRRPDQPR